MEIKSENDKKGLLMKTEIGFIGSGNMAEAIMAGIIKTGLCKAECIIASDKSKDRIDYLGKSLGIKAASSNKEVFKTSEVIILSVKPQNMKEILEDIRPEANTSEKKIIISIAAGIQISFIESVLYSNIEKKNEKQFPVSRVMPNTPGLAGAGMTGICFNRNISDMDAETVKNIFGSMGKTLICSESDMDGITAMSGSGPAYVFYFMESMISAGKKLGFSDDESLLLTMETIKGAVKLMETQNEAPESLRKKVTSPGGTTEAAIKHMESAGVKTEIVNGIIAASSRSKELSKLLSN